MAGRWDGHVVWLTGAGSGLGEAMALEFARGGAKVALSGRRVDRLEAAAERIRALGAEALVVPCDVTDEASLDEAVAAVVARFGRLDVAVANAGYSAGGPVETVSMDDWRRQLEVNVVGAAGTAARAIPHLRATRGRLVLVGSVAAMVHFAKAGPYQASKAAILALGNTLSAELAGEGITCTTIHPGFVKSEIYLRDNQGQVRDGRRDRRPAQLLWETDDAARVMVSAIWKRKRQFVFTGHGRFGWFMASHFPGFVHWVTTRVTNDTRE